METAFDVDWRASPADVVAQVTAPASRIETLSDGGAMVWHHWPGPDDRPPLVLLHGGWGSWTHWIKSIPLLAAHHTLYVADMPGMGDAADAPEPHTAKGISDIVADGVADLLIGEAPYHLAGFSFGGVMGTWVASKHGNRCLSLTLVGAAGFKGLHFVVTGISVPDLNAPDDEIDAAHRVNLTRLMMADPNNIDVLALHVHRHNIARGRVRTRRISLSDALVDTLPRVTSPMGGIWGELDATGGGVVDILKRRDILRGYQPDCPFHIIDGAGHWLMYETPEVFSQTLLEHIRIHEGTNP